MSEALQSALAGEYASIYAYGRGGARLDRAMQDQALVDLAAHRIRRNQLRAWLVAADEVPGAPAPAYQLPAPVTGAGSARDLLATVELRLIPLYTALVADQGADAQRRAWAIRAIRSCALRAQAWGAPGQAFPWPSDLQPPI